MIFIPEGLVGQTTNKKDIISKLHRHHFRLNVVTHSDAGIDKTRNYIADVFKNRYDANLQHFLPTFLRMTRGDDIFGAVGVRKAEHSPLFLEQYLTKPSEQVVSEFFAKPVCRSQIVEIGNLVATRRGSSYLLFVVLAHVLHTAGFQWMLFTATQQVEQIILKMRFSPVTLCTANPHCIQDVDQKWGSYYQGNPRVMAGNLCAANAVIESHEFFEELLAPYRQHLHHWAQQIKEAP